jgi:hypothetical protein
MDAPTLALEEAAELAHVAAATLRDWLQLNGPFNAPSGDIERLGHLRLSRYASRQN